MLGLYGPVKKWYQAPVEGGREGGREGGWEGGQEGGREGRRRVGGWEGGSDTKCHQLWIFHRSSQYLIPTSPSYPVSSAWLPHLTSTKPLLSHFSFISSYKWLHTFSFTSSIQWLQHLTSTKPLLSHFSFISSYKWLCTTQFPQVIIKSRALFLYIQYPVATTSHEYKATFKPLFLHIQLQVTFKPLFLHIQ